MPSLLLNGWQLPIAQASQESVEVGGTWQRAYSGLLRRSRRGVKRQWTLTTSPMIYADAVALENMLMARGEQWQGEADTFSAKGTPAAQDNGITIVSNAGRYGNALWPRAPLVNLLTLNQATGSDALGNTTGFSICQGNFNYGNNIAGASTVTSSTSQYWQGARSVLATFGTDNYYALRLNVPSVSPGTQYTFSCYIRNLPVDFDNVALLINAIAQNNQSMTPAQTSIVVATPAWARFVFTFTTPDDCTAIDIRILPYYTNGYSIFFDGAMLQPGGAVNTWTPSSSLGTNLAYDISAEMPRGCEAVTLCGWARAPAASGAVIGALSTPDLTQTMKLYSPTTTQLSAMLPDRTLVAPWPTAASYAHVALTAGPQTTILYLDGVPVASGAASQVSFGNFTKLWFGNINGQNPWGGYIDELQFAPYAMSQAQLLGLTHLTRRPASQPALVASGSLMGGGAVNVLASDVKATFLSMAVDGFWQANMGRVDFTLSEV